MKKLLWILLAMSVVASLIFFIGCSDDETTNPIVKETGDSNAPELEASAMAIGFAGEMNNDMFMYMFLIIELVLENPDFPGAAKLHASDFGDGISLDSFYLTYHEDTEYWYSFFQTVDTQMLDTSMWIMSGTTEDSIQFLHGNEAVQWPDSTLLSGINHGVSLTLFFSDWLEFLESHQQASIVGEILSAGDVVVNGTASVKADFNDSDYDGPFCTFNIDLNTTNTDINLNLTSINLGGCPTSGTKQFTGAIDMNCIGDTSFTFNDWWSFTQTFEGTTVHNVIENSTTRWEFDGMCSIDSVSVPGKGMTAIMEHMR
jgi:hypothetical protein